MKYILTFDFRNVLVILFFVIISWLIGVYYGFLWGKTWINDWLVLSAYNSGIVIGEINGSSRVYYLLFEEYIKEHPYKIEEMR